MTSACHDEEPVGSAPVPTYDLAHPRLGQPFDALARYGAPIARRAVSLESPALVTGAMKKASLTEVDVGPIAEPLEILTRSLQREAGLHASVVSWRGRVRYVACWSPGPGSPTSPDVVPTSSALRSRPADHRHGHAPHRHHVPAASPVA